MNSSHRSSPSQDRGVDLLGPALLQKILQDVGVVRDIYKAMESKDFGDVVMAWTHILQQSKQLSPSQNPEKKCVEKSRLSRVDGNQYLASGNYQSALKCYNHALLLATKNSREMVLAYSNRSAVFFKLRIFSACLKDIETCFSIGCPSDIIEKLLKRKHECLTQSWTEQLANAMFSSQFVDEYFDMNGKRNPQIPCATAAVGVFVDNGTPSVVAVNDIEVGTVVAVETAFATMLHPDKYYNSCNYCHKMDLNLFPCDCCTFALFCSQDCKTIANKEYHKIESAVNVMAETFLDLNASYRACIKMRQACKSWKEFVKASGEINSANLANNTVKEIFDRNEKFSLLCMNTDKTYFGYGSMYNKGYQIASFMSALDSNTAFFPTGSAKYVAMKAFGRAMIKLTLFVPLLKIVAATKTVEDETTSSISANLVSMGMFSFTSKLKHDCNPNLISLGLNNKIALVAARPIKRGEDLNISYLLHWTKSDETKMIRTQELYFCFSKVCGCQVCIEDWACNKNWQELPTDDLKKMWKRINCNKILSDLMSSPSEAQKYSKVIFEAVGKFSGVPRSKEYNHLFTLFIRYMMIMQHSITNNTLLNN